MAELKPCPFCGGTNITILSKKTNIWRNGFGDCVEYRVYSARCNRCNARGATAGGQCAPAEKTVKIYGTETLVHSYEYYREKAAEAWNARYLIEYNVEMKDRWIPCSERMPEEETDVIAVIDGCSREAFYSDSSFIGSNFYRNAEEVIYWMPKPEPPKEDET